MKKKLILNQAHFKINFFPFKYIEKDSLDSDRTWQYLFLWACEEENAKKMVPRTWRAKTWLKQTMALEITCTGSHLATPHPLGVSGQKQ